MHALWQNEVIVWQRINAVWKRNHSGFFTITAVDGGCLFPLEIFPEITYPFKIGRIRYIRARSAGVVKRRTAVHNPDRKDVSGVPWQSPNLMQNPYLKYQYFTCLLTLLLT